MGKLKRSTAIKKNLKQSKDSKKTKLTVEQLLEHAEENLDQFQLETAFKFVKQALDLDPKHTGALELMASIQMEMGNLDSAKSIYRQLIDLDEASPTKDDDFCFRKYMCLAQLSAGQEAVDLYKKGIERMLVAFEKQEKSNGGASSKKPSTSAAAWSMDDDDDDEEEDEEPGISKLDISTAYGSLGEIYLTDLCMEPDAAKMCKEYLDKSLEYDASNPETLQLLASYWLSEANLDESRKHILASVDKWLPAYVHANENGLDASQLVTLTYDSRINTARILTEVDEYDKAVTVLEHLLEEDDEVVVVWYMIGWANYCKGQEYYTNAKFYLKKAKELGAKIKYEQKYLDDQLRAHIDELLEQLKEVKSDDEDDEEEDLEDKENDGEEDNDISSIDDESEEEEEEEADDNNNSKTTPNAVNKKKSSILSSKKKKQQALNNNDNEQMEFS